MARYKTLKSVAHNIGSSFISTMNYYKDDYVLGHIQKQMRLSGLSKLEIDLLNNNSEPSTLITEAKQNSIESYVSWLPKLVNDSGSDINLVKEAKLTIEFDLAKSRICPFAPEYNENPYHCISKITDDRGKEYRYEFKDWWFPEALIIEEKEPNLWSKFFPWLKKK
jgi:hypothetical protein